MNAFRIGSALLLFALAVPGLRAAESPATGTPAAAEQFDLLEIRVLGNSVLPPRTIEELVYPHLGPDRSLTDVQAARAALEEGYRSAGYGAVYVDIPEQEVRDGIVRLQVTEGRVDRIRVTGTRYYSNRRILAALPALEKGSPLNLPELQEQLATLNQQTRDRSVVPVLKSGQAPGTVDVELKVSSKLPVHGIVEVNDHYAANTSPLRASATLSFDNLWQANHSLSLQYQTAPQETAEARVLAATYVMPRWNGMLATFYVNTDSEFTTLGPEFQSFGVVGQGQILGLRYISPLAPGPRYSHSLALGADYKDFREVITLGADDSATTPISYINWLLSYGGTLRRERDSIGFDTGVGFGIRGLANSSHEFFFKRSSGTPNKGEPNYFYLTGSMRYQRTLWRPLSMLARVSGQFTPHALISNEQFSAGGADSVRGYLESETLGDYGASGSLELHAALPAGLIVREGVGDAELFGFYDGGFTTLQQPLPGQDPRRTLFSAGLGFNLVGLYGVQSSLFWAVPLRNGEHVDKGDHRVHFQVRYGF